MRNLKKVLSLALALVMLLGMMVVGAGAAATEFGDAGSITYKEAADVLNAVNVLKGKDTGNFDPEGDLTRAQAATIIYRMIMGGMEKEPEPATTGFTDVDGIARLSWATGYIAACQERGIIVGVSETRFNPDGKVKGTDFAKMLLVALGYDADSQGYGGTGYASSVARDARTRGITVSGVALEGYLNREQAAQMALNTLKADIVEQQPGMSINGVVIPGGKATTVAHANGDKTYDGQTVSGTTVNVKFCELYFPNLTLSSTPVLDDFGRETKEWKVDNTTVSSTIAAPAVLTYTTKTSNTTIEKDLKANGAVKPDTDFKSKTNGTANLSDDITATSLATVATSISTLTAPGKKVEVYLNNSDNKVNAVIVTEYRVETVKSITEKNNETTYNFSLSGNKRNTEDATNVVLYGEVNAKDVVTTVMANNHIHVYPTESFTGSQTATRTSGGVTTVTINGEQYVVGTGVNKAPATPIAAGDFGNSADEATYWIDVNGFLVKTEGVTATADEYAVILRAVATASTSLDSSGYNVEVRAVLADGTIADYTLATSVTTDANQYNTTSASGSLVAGSGDTRILLCDQTLLATGLQTNAATALENKLFAYTTDSDGKMVISAVTTPTSSLAADSTNQIALTTYKGANNHPGASTQSGLTALFTSSTVFVLYHEEDGKWVVEEPKTGIAELSLDQTLGAPGIAVVAGPSSGTATSGTASLVFLRTASVAQSTDEYVYIDASKYTTILKDGKNTDAWTGIAPDGSEVEVYGSHASITQDGLYVYNTDMKLTATPKIATNSAAAAPTSSSLYCNIDGAGASLTGNLLEISGVYANITDDTQTVYVDSDLNEVAGNKCLVVMESNGSNTPVNVAAIFVYEAGDAVVPVLPEVTASIDKTSVTVAVSSTDTITVTCADGHTVNAESDATSTATASAAGDTVTISGVAEGTANVTITVVPTDASKGSKTFTVPVTVSNKTPVTASIDKDEMIVRLSETPGEFTVTCTEAGATVDATAADGTGSVTVAKKAVADDKTWTVTAGTVGTATITVTVSAPDKADKVFTVNVTVKAAKTPATVTGINVNDEAESSGAVTIATAQKGTTKFVVTATVEGGTLNVTTTDDGTNLSKDSDGENTWLLKSDATLTSGGQLTFKVSVTPDDDHTAPSEVTITVNVTTVS